MANAAVASALWPHADVQTEAGHTSDLLGKQT